MNEQPENQKIRPFRYAGQFYEGEKHELLRQLDELFAFSERQSVEMNRPLQAIIAPHAGYVFSGKVAAAAYSKIDMNADYKRIFILASSHRYMFNGAAVYAHNYSTPLGEINVDTALTKKLAGSSELFVMRDEVHDMEHSVEVHLPFLQYVLNNKFLLVPIIIGTQNTETCRQIAALLQPWFTPENLWIISTDFSHYPTYADACKTDEQTALAICSNRPEKLLEAIEKSKKSKIGNLATVVCGWTSVLTLLYLTQNHNFTFEKIYYQNSGDAKLYGEKKRVVGYWSIAVYETKNSFILSEAEKKVLTENARYSVTKYIKTGTREKIRTTCLTGLLNEKTGVFVSVYIDGKLRGCIGNFAGEKTLNELVQQMAVSASHDQRFNPVKPDELAKMKLEISVLSPLKKIENISEIELGKHGIYLKTAFSNGTFLPQVAIKTGWSVEELLGHCARDKAQIGWDGWKTAEIYTYEAIVFGME